ncbi:hypothetical protein BGZ60DRAFT_524251 [Tricladium varicosporioides]|nr:hypothetical protein BGZ60DRAFT_524251 [Hymenoscyphus varicosporioides]
MAFGGLALKFLSWFLRAIEFGCAAIILGIFSYFLATLHNHELGIATWIRAVEGISGAAVLYTIFALLLVCCLGGIAFISLLGMILDLAFTGAFIYVAWATRGGASSCSGFVNTPFGSGNTNTNNRVASGADGFTRLPSLRTACKLQTATFAVAIVACVFFFLSIFVEYGLIKHRRKEKAFGPSPNNGYTAGTPKRKFWQRKRKNRDMEYAAGEKPDALPLHATPADARASYATESTAVGNDPVYNKYGPTAAGGLGTAHTTNHATGYGHQTTTTTHVPHTHGANDTGTYQNYRNNPTGTF